MKQDRTMQNAAASAQTQATDNDHYFESITPTCDYKVHSVNII